jgi:hypothetical protein
MFSGSDFDRGSRFPLLWVFGPLIAGALLVTAVTIGVRATQGFPNIELADEIRQASVAGDPLLDEVTEFSWDRACVFPPSATADDVDRVLGIDWGVIGGDQTVDRRPLVVFVDGDRVVTHVFLLRGVMDPAVGGGDCRGPEDESTRL